VVLTDLTGNARMRPVAMTAIAMSIGIVPVALGLGIEVNKALPQPRRNRSSDLRPWGDTVLCPQRLYSG